MRTKPRLLGIHASPPLWLKSLYVALPFVLVIAGYAITSYFYLEDNPQGKLLPSYGAMWERFWGYATVWDVQKEHYPLWADTATSLIRFGTGLLYAAVVGLLLGVNIAMFPGLQYLALPGVVALSFVPVITMLPILLVVVGIGEEAKVLFIFLGLVFIITREMYAAAMDVAPELKIKALTLGSSQLALTYRIVLPMILPKLIGTIKLNLGLVGFCLIAAEGIAANVGL
jgi:NitT/TauT family transport system permease protein